MTNSIKVLSERSRCMTAGCLHYADEFKQLCKECKAEQVQRRNKRLRKIQRTDTRSPHEQGYDKVWRKTSQAYRLHHPVCESCESSLAKVVDHIVPIKSGGGNEPSNLQSLCHTCHNRKTFTENPTSTNKRMNPNEVVTY